MTIPCWIKYSFQDLHNNSLELIIDIKKTQLFFFAMMSYYATSC